MDLGGGDVGGDDLRRRGMRRRRRRWRRFGIGRRHGRQPCSLEEGAGDGLAECGTAQVPLFWENPDDGRTIEVAAKRWLAEAKSTGAGQIWLIQGGPGASGMMTFAPMMKTLREAVPEFDLYTIDHRGVGYSSPLTCPDEESEGSEGGAYIASMAEWESCITWLGDHYGDEFDAYSTRNAAHDLAGFIDATREEGKSVFVWGGSYGTYLVQRYLLLHPDQPTGAVVDSIHASSESVRDFYPAYDANGKRLMDLCGADEFCQGKLGADPWGVLAALYDKLEGGHCPELGIDRYTLSYLLGWLAWYSPYNAAAPALVYRLDRCEAADMDAIIYMFYNPFNGNGDLLGLTGGWYSQVLGTHIGMSDQYPDPAYDDTDMEAFTDDMLSGMMFGSMPTIAEYELFQMWPRYDEPQAREMPTTQAPVLMLQGDLDGATPNEVALPLADSLAGEHHYWYQFPYSAHGVMSDSWIGEYGAEPTCGMNIFVDFVRDPLTAPDGSCVADTAPTNFAGVSGLAEYMFDTADLWENDAAKSRREPVRPVRLEPMWGMRR
ncbi:MAG: alpha/beta hydrolase [Deltaproteobacteria bacterium]|nr:alpha/beta hydrolase [Deltaproteobacteria bacterium]